jgi:hypothetical protein
LLDLPVIVVDPLDRRAAREAGELLAADPAAGVEAAHAVRTARARGSWPVVTEAPGPLRALDHDIAIEPLP